MIEITSEKYLILYECLIDSMKILNLESAIKVFYCGTRLKWSIPNSLLIVTENDPNNRFYNEMNRDLGCHGSGYLDKPRPGGAWGPAHRKYTFHYKVLTEEVFNGLNGDWNRIADESWIYPKNMDYIPGIDITETMVKYNNLKAFL